MDPISYVLYNLLDGCLASPLHIDDLHAKVANSSMQHVNIMLWLDWLGYKRSSYVPCVERLKSTCCSLRRMCRELIVHCDVVALGSVGFVALPPTDESKFIKYNNTVVTMLKTYQDFWPGLAEHRSPPLDLPTTTAGSCATKHWSVDGATLPRIDPHPRHDYTRRANYTEDRVICGIYDDCCSGAGAAAERVFGAVFDGHGGDDTSGFLAQAFSGVFRDRAKLCGGNVVAALHGAFVQCNRMDYDRFAARQSLDDSVHESGSSCVVVATAADKVHVAWSGDSRYLVLGFKGEIVGSNSLRTHQTRNPDEVARLRRLLRARHRAAPPCEPDEDAALMLQRRARPTTRGFGDHSFRQEGFIVDPEFESFPASKVACVVLLSHGVTGTATDEDIARAMRTGKGATRLVHEALWSRGSRHDVTALVLAREHL